MNQHSLEIRTHNVQAHLDIEEEIGRLKNGQFTFIIRVNNGNVVDLVVMEYANARKYLVLKQIVIEELTLPRPGGVGSTTDPLRPDNI